MDAVTMSNRNFFRIPFAILLSALSSLHAQATNPAAADFFNTGQKMLGGVVPQEALTAPIRARAFAAIQLERERAGNEATRRPGLGDNRLPLAVEAAIREAYPNAAAFGRAGRVLTP